jgi:hypothetical protein
LDSRKYERVPVTDTVRVLSVGAIQVASPFFKERMRNDFKPVAVGVNAHPSPSSSPLRRGEATRLPYNTF